MNNSEMKTDSMCITFTHACSHGAPACLRERTLHASTPDSYLQVFLSTLLLVLKFLGVSWVKF